MNQPKKIFISSTFDDLRTEREAIRAVIHAEGFQAVRMEDFTANPAPPIDVCLDELNKCDGCIILVGPRYGSVFQGNGLSYSENEYECAIHREPAIPVFPFLKTIDSTEIEQLEPEVTKRRQRRNFEKKLKSRHYIKTFTDLKSLEAHVRDMLQSFESISKQKEHRYKAIKSPEGFFELQKRALTIIARLKDLSASIQAEASSRQLERLLGDLQAASFVVAFAGQLKSGKSTLVNAFVGRNISPVGDEPTTGIAIMIAGGKTDTARIAFQNGKTIEVEADASTLTKFVSQEYNPENQQGVAEVSVLLQKTPLDQGVLVLDVPGLNDPNPLYSRLSRAALEKAHAIIYVIDVAPASAGGAYLTEAHLQDLRALSQNAGKVFIAASKMDQLNPGALTRVKQKLASRLQAAGLPPVVSTRVYFVSALKAIEHQLSSVSTNNGSDSVHDLELAVWSHILSSGQTGRQRVYTILSNAAGALDVIKQLIHTYTMSEGELRELRLRLGGVISTENKLRKNVTDDIEIIRNECRTNLSQFKDEALTTLSDNLKSFEVGQTLPSKHEVQALLQRQLANHIVGLELSLRSKIERVADTLDGQIHALLLSAGLQSSRYAEQLDRIKASALDLGEFGFYEKQWNLAPAAIFGFFGSLFGGWPAVLGWGLFGAIIGFFESEEERRERHVKNIEKILKRASAAAQESVNSTFLLIDQGLQHVGANFVFLIEDRVGAVSRDIEFAIKSRATPAGVSDSQLRDIAEQISLIEKEIDAIVDTLVI